jgi:hypothetical protein
MLRIVIRDFMHALHVSLSLASSVWINDLKLQFWNRGFQIGKHFQSYSIQSKIERKVSSSGNKTNKET